jgi:hypothetical protein
MLRRQRPDDPGRAVVARAEQVTRMDANPSAGRTDADDAAGPSTATTTAAADQLRLRGECRALFAFDLGFRLDLEAAEQRLSAEAHRRTVSQRKRTPAWFQYEPPPLRVAVQHAAIDIAGFATAADVQCTLFDFGAASIAFQIPIDGPLDDLLPLGEALYDNQALIAAAREALQSVLTMLGQAAENVAIADFIEDYTIFAFRAWESEGTLGDLVARHRGALASLLRAETRELSEQEVHDCLATRLSYGRDDVAIVDWHGALLFDAEPDDGLILLEHANVELVELRCLDSHLDTLIEHSHAMMGRQSRFSIWPLSPGSRDVRKLADAQVDSALMFEGMNNAIKLVGDQYLARVYHLASEKLHMPAWDAAVLRKIETAERIFEKITHRQTTRRMEVLEIIIILLILISVIMPFIPWLSY